MLVCTDQVYVYRLTSRVSYFDSSPSPRNFSNTVSSSRAHSGYHQPSKVFGNKNVLWWAGLEVLRWQVGRPPLLGRWCGMVVDMHTFEIWHQPECLRLLDTKSMVNLGRNKTRQSQNINRGRCCHFNTVCDAPAGSPLLRVSPIILAPSHIRPTPSKRGPHPSMRGGAQKQAWFA